MILVTTAGKVGSEAARLPAQRGAYVRVLARDPEKATALRQAGDVAAVLTKVLGRPVVFSERTVEEDKQAMMSAGVPEPIAAMNARAVSLIAQGDAAWLSQDVPAILGRPARSFEQFATDHAAAFA